ncbi:hypothetical protein I6H46_06415 [Anaerococcus obesiensis]|uniref:Alpha/beta hydrolase n=1 Tax=Anaerococcus obesiensis TaxID=1287640 RepID=A0A7T7USY3_9FIRM|nr:hypothetical protein [Anaerococcus obesiensis]QQN55544.1 hypothetical protein I6H46_06415 [Anaerococcus obesiensis]
MKNKLNKEISFEELLREIINFPFVSEISAFLEKSDDKDVEKDYSDEEMVYTKIFKGSNNLETSRLRVLVHGAFGSWENFKYLATELCQQNAGDVLILGVSNIKNI